MPLATLIRSIGLLSLALCMTAIGVGKFAPPPAPSSVRLRVGTTLAGINGILLPGGDRTARLVDAETGAMTRVETGDQDRVEHLSVSPWVDSQSRRQAVGRWFHREGSATQLIPMSIGLARVELPSGRLIEGIESKVAPVSPPCWSPGVAARVIFASGDGKLYRFAFEDPERPYGSTPDESPVELAWHCTPPSAQVYMAEPHRPSHPLWKGRLLVALNVQTIEAGRPRMSPAQIWWLELNPDETAIIAAGRVTSDLGPQGLERCPMVVGPPSHPSLGYIGRSPKGTNWELRVVPLEMNGSDDAPRANTDLSTVVANDCSPSLPALSADGLRLTCLIKPNKQDASAFGVDLTPVLGLEHTAMVAKLGAAGDNAESR